MTSKSFWRLITDSLGTTYAGNGEERGKYVSLIELGVAITHFLLVHFCLDVTVFMAGEQSEEGDCTT